MIDGLDCYSCCGQFQTEWWPKGISVSIGWFKLRERQQFSADTMVWLERRAAEPTDCWRERVREELHTQWLKLLYISKHNGWNTGIPRTIMYVCKRCVQYRGMYWHSTNNWTIDWLGWQYVGDKFQSLLYFLSWQCFGTQCVLSTVWECILY